MTKAYEIVILAKEKNHIESDYGIAKLLGIDQSHLGHWKKGRAEPNAINYLKLIKLSGLSIDEALLKMTEPPTKPDDRPKNNSSDVYYVK